MTEILLRNRKTNRTPDKRKRSARLQKQADFFIPSAGRLSGAFTGGAI